MRLHVTIHIARPTSELHNDVVCLNFVSDHICWVIHSSPMTLIERDEERQQEFNNNVMFKFVYDHIFWMVI